MKIWSIVRSRRFRIAVLGSLLLGVGLVAVLPPARSRARVAIRGAAYKLGIKRADFRAAEARLRPVLGEGEKLPFTQAKIVVKKSERRLELYSGDRLIKEYKIGLGQSPEGHKLRQGGGQTPEGDYFICSRLERSRFNVFMGINYPNSIDAKLGLDEMIIDQSQHDLIVRAERDREVPPWNTRMGGAIGIHGSGSHADWTLGCVALDDADVEEIWVATSYWTPVKVRP